MNKKLSEIQVYNVISGYVCTTANAVKVCNMSAVIQNLAICSFAHNLKICCNRSDAFGERLTGLMTKLLIFFILQI